MIKSKPLNVALGAIHVSKNNPRKFFNEAQIDELAQSIKEQGVLQPITVRTMEGEQGYELIFGERRYRAAMKVYEQDPTRLTIPCQVYDNLPDGEAQEMQITENLQRADIHPMEEAVAFKALLESRKYELAEIAKRMGKTIFYVGQRLKLNELIEPLQAAFFADRMDLIFSLELCKFSAEIQNKLWKDHLKNESGYLQLNDWTLNKYRGNLRTSVFNQEDPELNKAMGACTHCQHNTAHAGNLFPDQAKEARCLMVACFQKKVDNHYKAALEEAKNDGTTIFINTEYGHTTASEKLQKSGHKVYHRYDVNEQKKPVEPQLSWYKETEYPNPEALNAAFSKDTDTYHKHIKFFTKKVEAGEYLKGFIVSGDNAGGISYFVITKKQAEEKSKDGKVTPSSTKAEIARLKERQRRNKELDEEKVLPQIYELLDKRFYEQKEKVKKKKGITEVIDQPAVKDIGAVLHHQETVALVMLMLDHAGYMVSDTFFDAIGFEEEDDLGFYNHLVDLKLPKLLEYVNILTRLAILRHFKPGKNSKYTTDDKMAALVAITRLYNSPGVNEILKAQNDIALKREERVASRIKGLEATLKPVKEAPAKAAPAKKKAAKKEKTINT